MIAKNKKGQNPYSLEQEITLKIKTNYLLFLPKKYSKKKNKYPLILFLHGLGESGNDLDLVKIHGPPKFLNKNKKFPFIVLSPQCPERDWWSNPLQVKSTISLLNNIIAKYNVDETRIYLTGLSMGGFGTWKLASEYPNKFAAIAPICGAGNPKLAKSIAHIPTWIFHGAKDPVIPISKSQEMAEALKKSGGKPKFTIYPNAGHDSWTESYANPELFQWFLKHKITN